MFDGLFRMMKREEMSDDGWKGLMIDDNVEWKLGALSRCERTGRKIFTSEMLGELDLGDRLSSLQKVVEPIPILTSQMMAYASFNGFFPGYDLLTSVPP